MLSPQKELILSHLRSGEWVCQTAWLGAIKDDRKRISELNATYMKEKGFEIIGEPCDGRCGKEHSSGLFMRRAIKLPTPSPHSKKQVELFMSGAPSEIVLVA